MRDKTDPQFTLTRLQQWGWKAWSKYPSKNGLMIDGKKLDKDIARGLFPPPPIEVIRVHSRPTLLQRFMRLLGF